MEATSTRATGSALPAMAPCTTSWLAAARYTGLSSAGTAFASFGPETSTITYCQAGVRAAFTHLVLTALGHDAVRTYDGSWEEWGNDPTLPIITGRS